MSLKRISTATLFQYLLKGSHLYEGFGYSKGQYLLVILLGVYLNVDQSGVFGLAMYFLGEAPSCMSLEVQDCR